MTIIWTTFLASLVLGGADDPAPLQRFQQEAEAYEMRLAGEPGSLLKLTAKPILHWGNPAANGEDGAVFVWLHKGRPEVIGTFFTYRRASTGEIILKHSLHSLASQSITGDYQKQRVWSPKTAGVEFRPVPEAPVPAGTGRLRLLQMKSLAKGFSGKLVNHKGESFSLRLLPEPLVRYEPTGTDVVDGAIFALAEGTDPQALVLVEARKAQGQLQFEYAFARFHFASLWGYYRDAEVWHVETDVSQTRSFLGDPDQAGKIYISLQKR